MNNFARFISIVLCAVIMFVSAPSAAAAVDASPSPELPADDSNNNVSVQSAGSLDGSYSWLSLPNDASGVEFALMPMYTDPNTPVTSANGLKGILINMLGSYDPQVVQVRYQTGSSSYYSFYNVAFPDVPWIAAALVLLLLLWQLLRMVGGIIWSL